MTEFVDAGLALAAATGAICGWLIRRIIYRSDGHDRRLGNLEVNSARHHERLVNLERQLRIDHRMPRTGVNGRTPGS